MGGAGGGPAVSFCLTADPERRTVGVPNVMNTKSMLRSPLRRGDFYTGVICLAPSFLVIAVFVIFPIFFSLFLSFHEWAILTPEKPFVGLANF
jgi:hypothetical protein